MGTRSAPGWSQAGSPGTEADSSWDVYINMISKPQLKNNLGAVLGAGGEEKRRKPKKPLASSAPADPCDFTHWGCLDETRLLSPVRLGPETATGWTQPPRTSQNLPEPQLSTQGEENKEVNTQE